MKKTMTLSVLLFASYGFAQNIKADSRAHQESSVLDRSPCRRKVKANMPSIKTHSGAKKRLQRRPGGTVKRKQVGMRHLNSHMSSKRKRHLGQMTEVADANMLQVHRTLVF